ncbi:MAG: hypothetical protein ABSH44_10350 [Bryobacteraceae bacterium]|jgi:hypothetical protein
MPGPARGSQISRRSWLLAGLTVSLSPARGAQPIEVTFDGDNLHVSAPSLHFLTGKPLERLKDAATVVFLSQLTLFGENHDTVIRRVPGRFVVSYDLWEEKFSVTQLGSAPRSTSHLLSAAAAESWCLEGLAISALGLAQDRPFWLRFELRPAEQKDLASGAGEPGLSLRSLIEMFSRRPGPDDLNWTREAGPLRLEDLRRAAGRGARNG